MQTRCFPNYPPRTHLKCAPPCTHASPHLDTSPHQLHPVLIKHQFAIVNNTTIICSYKGGRMVHRILSQITPHLQVHSCCRSTAPCAYSGHAMPTNVPKQRSPCATTSLLKHARMHEPNLSPCLNRVVTIKFCGTMPTCFGRLELEMQLLACMILHTHAPLFECCDHRVKGALSHLQHNWLTAVP